MTKEVTVIIEIKKRPFWSKVLRFPLVLKSHYKIFRKYYPPLESFFAAWYFGGMIFKVK